MTILWLRIRVDRKGHTAGILIGQNE